VRGLDTNILLRYLRSEDPSQSHAVKVLFERAQVDGDELYVTNVVLCEMVWVMRSRYRMRRDEISSILDALLAFEFLRFQDLDIILQALEDYRTGSADFADYLIGLQNRREGCQDTLTFDRALEGASGFTILR
jgi:predicted nucleic-acid-binding protein